MFSSIGLRQNGYNGSSVNLISHNEEKNRSHNVTWTVVGGCAV